MMLRLYDCPYNEQLHVILQVEEFGVESEFRCRIGAHEVINFMSWNLLFSAELKIRMNWN